MINGLFHFFSFCHWSLTVSDYLFNWYFLTLLRLIIMRWNN